MADPQVSFQVHREPEHVRLAVTGDLDLASAGELAQRAAALVPEAPGLLLIDFSGVDFCDSAGIRALLSVRKAAERAGCELRLTGVRDRHVRWVLHVTALDTVIPVDEPYEPTGT
ncbi:MAG TPA: STAS domain-containing protein [Rugosimonospora sp.]|nr:STAS domain-containing protein [Rugosimonospora sp.]